MMRPMPMASMQARRSGVPTTIDLSTAIVCTRSTEASYQTGAETDGSSSFLAWASANVLRVQNRGSRNAIFVEGSRTNTILRSREMTNAAWTAGNMTQAGNDANGVDATLVAARFTGTGSQFSARQAITIASGSVGSVWARAVSGSQPIRMNYMFPTGTRATQTLTTTYARHVGPVATPTSGTFYVHDCSIGGNTSIYADGAQVEAGQFATSLIRTSASTVTRSADACVIASASIPSWLRSGKWQCTISLECTSAEFIAAATEMTLFAFSTGTNDRISLVLDSGSMKVRVVQGGVTKVTTGAITATSRYLDITLTFDAAAGSVTVAGATTGNGTTTATAWTMQSGDVYVGNGSGGTTPYFGEILPTVSEVP